VQSLRTSSCAWLDPSDRFVERFLELLNKYINIKFHGSTKGAEFDEVDSTLPAFAFADKGLCAPELPSEFGLREVRSFSGLTKMPEEKPVFAGVNRLLHHVPHAPYSEVQAKVGCGIVQKRLWIAVVAKGQLPYLLHPIATSAYVKRSPATLCGWMKRRRAPSAPRPFYVASWLVAPWLRGSDEKNSSKRTHFRQRARSKTRVALSEMASFDPKIGQKWVRRDRRTRARTLSPPVHE